MMFPFLGSFYLTPHPGGGYSWKFFKWAGGGGVPVSSPNPDPFSDQKVTFSHPVSDLAAKKQTPFKSWPLRNNVIIT